MNGDTTNINLTNATPDTLVANATPKKVRAPRKPLVNVVYPQGEFTVGDLRNSYKIATINKRLKADLTAGRLTVVGSRPQIKDGKASIGRPSRVYRFNDTTATTPTI